MRLIFVYLWASSSANMENHNNTTKKLYFFCNKVNCIPLLAVLLFLAHYSMAVPDEGMWLPLHIKRLNYADMQKQGLKLSAEEIYSINSSSLKDAIVQMGNFCTAEVISRDGLLLTNHHCGYDYILKNSTLQNDYLANGFWAMNRSQELANPGLTVSFLVRMEDVTNKVLANIRDEMPEAERTALVQSICTQLETDAIAGTGYNAGVKPFFNGNEYYLFVYETFRDVRLVGAPPSAIGKFGGDVDNWMWPRHTGDFSMFRIYTGPDGKPADYNPNNIPLKPKYHLPVSLKGVLKGDFAMIMGYPARTDRYLSSYGLRQAITISNPLRVEIRARKLEIIKGDMETDRSVALKLSGLYANISNYWKYYIGQSRGLKKLKVAEKKELAEANFTKWANSDPLRKAKYANVLPKIAEQFNKRTLLIRPQILLSEAFYGAQITRIAAELNPLQKALTQEAKPEIMDKVKMEILKNTEPLFKLQVRKTDEKLLAAAIGFYQKYLPSSQRPDEIDKIIKKSEDGDYLPYCSKIYEASFMESREKFESFLKSPSLKELENDPIFKLYFSVFRKNQEIVAAGAAINQELEHFNRLYVAGTMEMAGSKKKFSPNANSTMRLTFGKVLDYSPQDAIEFNHFTTTDGILQKEDSANIDFNVPAKLKELIVKKDFGPYAENGTMKVAFLTNTDITGGNSGSPVLNAKGELVGLAFDGNWEAMSGDIAFEPELQRTISNDIRYILFVIDKFAGAKHLVNELTLTGKPEDGFTTKNQRTSENVNRSINATGAAAINSTANGAQPVKNRRGRSIKAVKAKKSNKSNKKSKMAAVGGH